MTINAKSVSAGAGVPNIIENGSNGVSAISFTKGYTTLAFYANRALQILPYSCNKVIILLFVHIVHNLGILLDYFGIRLCFWALVSYFSQNCKNFYENLVTVSESISESLVFNQQIVCDKILFRRF